MGNDSQQWRIAIGCFSPRGPSAEKTRVHSSLKRSSKKSNVSSVESNIRTTPRLRVFPLLLVIVTLLLVIGGVHLNPGPKVSKFSFENSWRSEHSTLDHPLDSVLERHGLAIVENSGEGDCLFEALSDQLKRLTSGEVNANDLRQSLLKCIRVHTTLPNGEHVMTLFDSEDNKDWQQFSATLESTEDLHTRQLSWYTDEYMVRSGVWGDNLMLYAFAKLYSIDIAIYSAGIDEPYTMTANEGPGDKERMLARLGYISRLHFVSLVNITDVNDGEISWRVMSDRLGDLFLQLLNSEVVEDREATIDLLSQMVDSFFEAKNKSVKWPDGLSQLVDQLVQRELERATGVVPGFLKHADSEETRAIIMKECAPKESSLQKLLRWYEHMSDIFVDDNEDRAHSFPDGTPLRGANPARDSRHAFDEDSTEQQSDERELLLDNPNFLDNVLSLLRDIERFLNFPPLSSNEELDERVQLISKIVDNSIKNKHDVPDGLIKIVTELASRELNMLSAGCEQMLKKTGAQAIQNFLNKKKDATSESRGQMQLNLLQGYERLVKSNTEYNKGQTPTTSSNYVLPGGGISQLKKLLEMCVHSNKAKKRTYEEKIDYIPEGTEFKEITKAMYDLGKEITKQTEVEKQATLMCDLGKEYADLAKETREGWHFNYATALYNAALQRLRKIKAGNEVILADRFDYIQKQLQQLETGLLETVFKENKEPLRKSRERYRGVLEGIRKYSKEAIQNIHTKDMLIDSVTFEMNEKCQRRTIENSKCYYDTLTSKIIELHKLMIDDCISVLGRPNCRFAIIGLGSLARKEVTAWSDLESAILYDPTGKSNEEIEKLKRDFRMLVHYLHLKIINLGETKINALDIPVLCDFNSKLPNGVKDNDFYDEITPQGLCFDGSLPKASKIPFGRRSTKHPTKQDTLELIMTLDEMSQCQIGEVSLKEGYHLSDVLLTSTLITGDESLWNEYNEKVHEILSSRSTIDPKLSVGKQRGIETLGEDLKANLTKPLTPNVFNKTMRAKHNIYRFATISINILKLLHHCRSFSPLDILDELHLKQVLSESAKTDLQLMVCMAINMRHLVYGRCGQQREMISFITRPSRDELITAYDYVSVRDYAPAIFRFYATLIPWTDFLLYNYCFNDLPTCKHPSSYIDLNPQTTAAIQKEMYMFQGVINSLECQKFNVIQNDTENKEKCVPHLSRGDSNKSTNTDLQEEETSAKNSDTFARLDAISDAYFGKCEFDKAIQYHKESLAMKRTIHGNYPHPDIASTLGNLGNTYRSKGEFNKAIQYHKESLAMKRTIHGNHPHPDIASTLGNLGNAFGSKGEFDKAIQYHKESLAMMRTIHGYHPHPVIASTLASLGNAYKSKGEFDKAIQYHNESLAMQRTIHGNHPHPDLASTLGNLGIAYNSKGEFDKAIKCYKECLVMQRTIHGNHPHPGIASSLGNLGNTYDSKGEFDKAIQYHKESLAMERTINGDHPHPGIASSLVNLGNTYDSKGEFDKAIQYHNESLAMQRTIHGNHPHPNIASTLVNLGSSYYKKGDHTQSLQYYTQSLIILKQIHGDQPHPAIASILSNIGVVCSDTGDNEKALQYFTEGLAMKRQIYGNQPHPNIASTLHNIGIVYDRTHKYADALKNFYEARGMLKKIHGDNPHPDYQVVLRAINSTEQLLTRCIFIMFASMHT
ncbi:unnamed protein product [Owenia fusiformis]|uniref:Uncharacterized protein n=1 Tax=Owenia fusiformis TaxID=6347 RepID=A0A8J1YAQ3_OWEFU|nr:unnamed protein product [Owenia fusiformis]